MSTRSFGAILVGLTALLAGCASNPLAPASTQVDLAQKAITMLQHAPGSDVRPTGQVKEFTLYVHRMSHELYPGATMGMWGFSLSEDPATAQFPGPTLRVTEGDTVIVHLRSTVAGYNHTIHWHGQNVPGDQDGVPYVSQKPVEPGDEFTYTFVAKPAGTYWYHCHVDAQHHIDMGMYGALIVDPQNAKQDPPFDKEFVMLLDDMDRYHLEGGQPATGNAPQGGDTYSYEQYAQRQANDLITRNPQASGALSQANTSARPNRDWYPVTYAPYTADYQTFLINGQAFPYTKPLVAQNDTVIRIRMINAGNTNFAMHLHGHHALVTHKDGVQLESPYWIDVLNIAPGERYDLYVKLDNPGMWDFHDHIGGHTQNDNIFPGGAMTMLCYEGVPACTEGGGHQHGSRTSSGDLVLDRWAILQQALP